MADKKPEDQAEEDSTENIEQQVDAIFRNFLFERFQEDEEEREEQVVPVKSSDPSREPAFPGYYGLNNSQAYEKVERLGFHLRIIGDKIDDSQKYKNVERLGFHLRIIGDKIDDRHRAEFQDIISRLSQEAVGQRSYVTFMWLMKRFIEILKSSVNFPVSLIKASFQTLVAVWLNPNALADNALVENNPEACHEISQDVPDSCKSDVRDLNKRAIETYLRAIKNENEIARHIRIMVIGMFGAGKTSLVQNLLSLDNISLESTDGIDIHVDECFVSDSDEWLFQEAKYAEISDYKFRVAALMSKSTSSVESSDNIEIIYQRQNERPTQDKEVRRQASISSREDLDKMKKVLDSFRDSDPVLGSFWRDICNAWEITESQIEGGKNPIKSSTQATVSVWDFAGQDVYYSTHHFFMNPASIYLLTMDISIPLMSKISGIESKSFSYFHEGTTCLDAFKFWLNSVHTYSAKYGKETPTVILVGTHIDKVEGNAEEKQQRGEEYFDEALKSFMNSPVLQHIHAKKFFIDNTNPDEDFSSLRKEILYLAKNHRSWNQVVPARWILLERALEQVKLEGKEMITLEDLMKKNTENEYPIGSKNELKSFLRFHHSLGNLLYFDTELLDNSIILSPQWIVDAFRGFVTNFVKKDPKELSLWDAYEKQAKLSPVLLNSIISGNDSLADYKDEVINYMEHLDIMAQPSIYTTNDELANGDSKADDEVMKERMDFHIVPCMLSAKPPQKVMNQVIHPDHALKTSILCFVFSGEFLPPAIFHRLVAVCINKWPVSTREKQFLLYRGLAVFSLTPSIELAIWIHDHIIFGRMILYSSMDTKISDVTCLETRTFISATLQNLLGIYKDKWSTVILPFEEYIHCDKTTEPLSGLIAVKDLVDNKEVVCKAHSEVHVIKSEEVLAQWYPENVTEIKMTDQTRNLQLSDDDLQKVPTEKDLTKLSSKIGHEYFRLGIDLGLERATIQHCEARHMFDVPTRILSMLQEWKKIKGKSATLEKLKTSMENVDCNMDGFYGVFFS